MKQRIWISMGAIVLGVSTLTIGYAAAKHGDDRMCCENMMHGDRVHAMGKNHMGMMGTGMPRECVDMMKRHRTPAIESPSAGPPQ